MTSEAPFSVSPCHTCRRARTRRLVMLAVAAFIVIGSLTTFVKDASAVVCPPPTGFKSIGATCYYVNGVIVDAQLKFVGNLNAHPKSFKADLAPTGDGVLFCGNNGGNQAPGQRIIQFVEPFSCKPVDLKTSDVDSPQNGGTADHVLCDARVTPEQLQSLGDKYCSNGQFALDFIPCQFDSIVTYTSDTDGSVIEQAKHRCSLANCTTLKWNNKAGMPEFRQYDCVGPVTE